MSLGEVFASWQNEGVDVQQNAETEEPVQVFPAQLSDRLTVAPTYLCRYMTTNESMCRYIHDHE